MEKHSVKSSFKDLPVDIFWYPSFNNTTDTVLILKGIYGYHNPDLVNSWENKLIKECNEEYNFLCVNTSRLEGADNDLLRSSNFKGKTYDDECDDVGKAFEYLIDNGFISKDTRLSVVANSFGGTVLLGINKIVDFSKFIIMIGSGCGKKPDTTKPLLETLPEEMELLSSIKAYKGAFAFVRGALDNVVPIESQDKIKESAKSACINISYVVPGVNHKLDSVNCSEEFNKTKFLKNIMRHLAKFT